MLNVAIYKYVGPPGYRAEICTPPSRMLPPGESWRVCRRDRRTDGRTPDRYTTLSARRGTCAIVQHPNENLADALGCDTASGIQNTPPVPPQGIDDDSHGTVSYDCTVLYRSFVAGADDTLGGVI